MYIVNAPWVFRKVWEFVAKLVDKRTRQKVTILGGPKEYGPLLLAESGADNLPTFLGGRDESCDFVREKGPWAAALPDIARPTAERLPPVECG
eukprot:3815507-Prymnesium_polylepis.1